jgi:geranylgeranyl diphosphate synthase type I
VELQRQSTPVLLRQLQDQRDVISARLQSFFGAGDSGVYDICRYHMGWIDETGAPTGEGAGKMLRPLLCLAACAGYGEASRAVGVAAALELLHAFSLVHDDIEDGDRERRHRPTVWARFGVPLAINAGDMLFAMAHRALYQGLEDLDGPQASLGRHIFSETCMQLMEGQHLDLEFEQRAQVSLEEYVTMVRGKTGAVMGAALSLGALCGGADSDQVAMLRAAGVELGLAFQAVDDALALWGDPSQTGKAVGNDLKRGKKSLPVVLGAAKGHSWAGGQASLPETVDLLERAGVRRAIEQFATDHRTEALRRIASSGMSEPGQQQLAGLVELAVTRDA